MTWFPAAAAGSSMQMSQTMEQEQRPAPAKPGERKGMELFWRIIAGLILVTIAWVLWVVYQIAPRSVATPLAYEAGAKSMGKLQTAAGAGVPGALPTASTLAAQAMTPRVLPAEPAAADLAMEQAQAAARAGAHQASADVQAAHLERDQRNEREPERLKMEGLKLSTEIATPPAGNK
jgi:hypothetical protein